MTRKNKRKVALPKLEAESGGYAQREYNVTAEQLAALELAVDARYERLKRTGKLMTLEQAKESLIQIDPSQRRPA